MTIILFIIFAVFAYLLGSISSAVLVCKFLGLPDPRTQGSQNPGTTNVMRIGGKNAAILTLVGDILKGFIPVILARLFGITGFWLGMIAVAALLGHVFPLFFQFKGGKGVATAFGGILAMAFPAALIAVITWLLVLVFSRYSSLAAIVTAVLLPIYILLFADFNLLIPTIIISAILLWRHWDNIQRLRAGTEGKMNF